MRAHLMFPIALALLGSGAAASDRLNADRLVLPAHRVSVDLKTGEVSNRTVTGQCLETVSRAGAFQLVSRKAPGDDAPTVTLNGTKIHWLEKVSGKARLGGLRLSRDGSLFVLRTWKTGDKQTELLKDGQIIHTWQRGNAVKLIGVQEGFVTVLENKIDHTPKLIRYQIGPDTNISKTRTELVDFGTCKPGRLRIKKEDLWAQLDCDERGKGIYKISLATGDVPEPLISTAAATFVAVPKTLALSKGEVVAIVSGTPAAMHFYKAVTGLFLSQSGEVRACSSDAEGAQSWNQSYRLRSLAALAEKTGVSVFSDLAVKSMRLTLAARDGVNDRAAPANPACGWSSTIYGTDPDERLSLMINQAMIANALSASCQMLGANCPTDLADEISDTAICLAAGFEDRFDPQERLYRIGEETDFRFAGSVAPWNWQMSFASLLKDHPEQQMRARAENMVQAFLETWQADPNGALWRYWPDAYYREKGIEGARLETQRFEDTGHAGISLLSLNRFADVTSGTRFMGVGDRLDYLVSYGNAVPRDLDGRGPRTGRWYPAGGWAHYATPTYISGPQSQGLDRGGADALYAAAYLFDPTEEFDLKIDLYVCAQSCEQEGSYRYDSWQAFLNDNPLFQLTRDSPREAENRQVLPTASKANVHKP